MPEQSVTRIAKDAVLETDTIEEALDDEEIAAAAKKAQRMRTAIQARDKGASRHISRTFNMPTLYDWRLPGTGKRLGDATADEKGDMEALLNAQARYTMSKLSPERRLLDLATAASRACSALPGAGDRCRFVTGVLQQDSNFALNPTFALMSKYAPEAVPEAVRALLRDAEKKIARQKPGKKDTG